MLLVVECGSLGVILTLTLGVEMAIPWGFLGAAAGAVSNFLGGSRDRADQMHVAKNQVQMRVEDANKAGISPLAAMGMNPISISPTSVGDPGFAAMGQAADRAVEAGSTGTQRMNNLQLRMLNSQIEGQELDNEIRKTDLASRLRLASGAGTPPALPGYPDIPANEVLPGQLSGVTVPTGVGDSTWRTGRGPSAQFMQDHYGEFGENAYGMAKMLADFGLNVEDVLKRLPGAGWANR